MKSMEITKPKLLLREKVKILKKQCVRCLASALLLGTLLPNAYATDDFQIQIAVLCKDQRKSEEFIDSMCREQSKVIFDDPSVGLHMTTIFTGEKNTEGQKRTIIYTPDIDTRYHVLFRPLDKVDKSVLRDCSGAILLYDIADPSLAPIINYTGCYPKSDLKNLLSTNTPLVNYINDLQYSWSLSLRPYWRAGGNSGWYKGINFTAYCSDPSLTRENYNVRHDKLNSFTCAAERYFGIDNKWGRGHPCIGFSDESIVCGKNLYWIQASAYLSIGEGWVSGRYTPPISAETETSLDLSPTPKKKTKSGDIFRRVTIGAVAIATLPLIYGVCKYFYSYGNLSKKGDI